MLGVTDAAVKEFKNLISESGANGAGIRVFATGGGCCGPSYGLDISEKGNEGDKIVEKDGLKIFVDPAVSDALDGASLDYINDGPRKGFTILGLQQSGCC
ncbi:MAG: HesB/IscA family protein [Spirochaetota bacterium]